MARTQSVLVEFANRDGRTRLRSALEAMGAGVREDGSRIEAKISSGWRMTRPSARISATWPPDTTGAVVEVSVVMNDDRHHEVFGELASALGAGARLLDSGLSAAITRMGSDARFLHHDQVPQLRHLLDAAETVAELGWGTLLKRPALVVLTHRRLVFLADERRDPPLYKQVPLEHIRSLIASRGQGGMTFRLDHAALGSTLTVVNCSRAEELAAAFMQLRETTPWMEPEAAVVGASESSAVTLGGEQIAQLEHLGRLHATGVLSDHEFAAAKQNVLASLAPRQEFIQYEQRSSFFFFAAWEG